MRSVTLAVLVLSLVAGCGKKPDAGLAPVEPAKYDPDAMAEAAIAQLDKNKDGTIDAAELTACPPLKKLKNGKGVTKADVMARF